MKFFFSEYKADYSKYHFPYQIYVIKEDSDELDKLYEMGLLPSRARLNLFYLARSLRIDLSKFEPTSENRRIQRKTEYLKMSIINLQQFKYDYTIGKLAKDFYDERFGKGTMSANRIKWLFTSGACSHVLVFKDSSKDKVIGYCIVNSTRNIMHYAYPFYETEYFEKNAGMGMMLQALMWAKGSTGAVEPAMGAVEPAKGAEPTSELKYVYLGTCYTQASLYKIQFKGVEYFNGFEWGNNVDKLKELVKNDIEGHILEGIENKDEVFEKKGIKLIVNR
jgi:arginine-tRNA-protein transferase